MNIEQLEKKCSKCGECKTIDLFFKNTLGKFGVSSWCKSCKQDWQRDWRVENRESDRKSSRKYASKHRNERRINTKNWGKANPHKRAAQGSKRRALKRNATHPEHNPLIESALHDIRLRVSDCFQIPFEVDHIWPLSKGGPHHHDNLQVIPKSLNNAKSANMTFRHPLLLDWTDLPIQLLRWIKDNNPHQFKQAVKMWVDSGQYTLDDFKNHLRNKKSTKYNHPQSINKNNPDITIP